MHVSITMMYISKTNAVQDLEPLLSEERINVWGTNGRYTCPDQAIRVTVFRIINNRRSLGTCQGQFSTCLSQEMGFPGLSNSLAGASEKANMPQDWKCLFVRNSHGYSITGAFFKARTAEATEWQLSARYYCIRTAPIPFYPHNYLISRCY